MNIFNKYATYHAIFIQKEYCKSYAIECGIALHPLQAKTFEDAVTEAKLVSVGSYQGEEWQDPEYERDAISEVYIVATKDMFSMPVPTWRQINRTERKRLETAQTEKEELALLAKLQAKHGKK